MRRAAIIIVAASLLGCATAQDQRDEAFRIGYYSGFTDGLEIRLQLNDAKGTPDQNQIEQEILRYSMLNYEIRLNMFRRGELPIAGIPAAK